MLKKELPGSDIAKPASPYSHALKVGDLIFVAGQISLDLKTGKPVAGDIRQQTKRALENVRTILESYGGSLHNVVKTTVFLQNFDDYAAMNEVYKGFFEDIPPTRSTIQVGALWGGMAVEIEAIAIHQKETQR